MPEGKTSTTNTKTILIKNVTVISLTSTAAIKQKAEDQEIDPQDVYVKVAFRTQDGKELEGSNRLKFFGKSGYKLLQESRENGTVLDVSLKYNPEYESCLIYIENDNSVSLDDLFAKHTESKRQIATRAFFEE